MIAHSDVAYVIDSRGRTREELDFDPGPGTATSVSSFAVELSQAAEHVMTSAGRGAAGSNAAGGASS
jgi:hypothetical protein